MTKTKMLNPIVEMDGDEMTRVIWKQIKDELICPFVDLNTEYYDLGLEYRNETDDKITFDNNADVYEAGNGNHGYFGVFAPSTEGLFFGSNAKYVDRQNVNATRVKTALDLSSFANDNASYMIGIEYTTSVCRSYLFVWN